MLHFTAFEGKNIKEMQV